MKMSKLLEGSHLAIGALLLLAGAGGARADVFDVTFNNVTFSAPCIGGTGTCTEVINGSGLYDQVANTVSLPAVQLTGTYTASLDGFPAAPHCVSQLCLPPDVLYDLAANTSDDPIEFSADLPTLNAPTPTALVSDSALYIPSTCGGDQATCGVRGDFPLGDLSSPSGTYTSVDVSTPEPSSVILFVSGIAMLGFLSLRKLLVIARN